MVSFKDITSSGGDTIAPLNFSEGVPKYDPSSFYNWEQDNIPLWVLEERGNTLWSQAGFPGGNPGGITFTLSSVGMFDEALGIYDNINDILERIPKRLKFPVLVELCTYGALGELDLANITCEGYGRLEFRNQAYFEDINASAVASYDAVTSPMGDANTLTSSVSIPASSMMLGVSSTRTEQVFGLQSSWNANARTFTMQGPDTDRQANNLTVSIFSGNDIGAYNSGTFTNGSFGLPPYTSGVDYTIPTGDANPVYGSGTPDVRTPFNTIPAMAQKRESMLTRGQSTLAGFGNWFSSINVKDCQGTIIFRNILQDGSNQLSDNATAGCVHTTETGWNIESSDVILDNTAAIRNSQQGYFFKNSRMRLTGHFMAWRNYTKTGKLAANRKKDGTGVLAVNTDMLWDSTYYDDSRKYLNWFGKSKRGMELRNSTMRGGIYSTIVSGVPNGGSQSLGSTVQNSAGVSQLYCSGAGGDVMTTILNFTDCNESGLHLEGSDVEFHGRLNSYLNQEDGIRALRSQIRVPQFTCNHNGGYGIHLQGSQFTYGWGVDEIVDEVGTNFKKLDGYDSILYTNAAMTAATVNTQLRVRNRAQFHCSDNNQNVLVTKSSALTPQKMNNIPAYYGRWGGADWTNNGGDTTYNIGTAVAYTPMTHFGATPYRENNLPGMVVTNNSDAEIVNLNYLVSSVDTGKGKVAVASNGSNLTFRGTSGCATTMNYFPVTSEAMQFRSWLAAGVVGTDNSNVEMTGPTKMARFGIPVLAENNSNFSVNPPCLVGTDNILDVSGYNLIDPAGGLTTSGNHTSLELHSTRSCMVANKQSNIRMYALGGKVVGDSAGSEVLDSVDVLATGYADTFLGDQNNQFALSTSGGYAKFYPNAFVSGLVLDNGVSIEDTATLNPTVRYLMNSQATNPAERHEEGTTGGMVVRAVGGSNLDLNLVNFQMFCQPGTLSGAFYNWDGSGCEYLPDVGGGDTGTITPPPGSYGIDFQAIPPAAGTDASELEGGNPDGGSTNTVRSGRTVGRIQDDSTTNTVGGTTSNNDGQGAIYTAAGKGNNNNSVFANTAQPGSTEVFGDGFSGTRSTKLGMYYRNEDGTNPSTGLDADPACMGSPIHIWNIADTSRIHASNLLINGLDPESASLGTNTGGANALNFHGPGGKWWNGVSLDYYGAGGRRTTYGAIGNQFANCGIYRLMFSTRGDLKGMYDVSTLSGMSTGNTGWENTVPSGGSFVDQINGQGYTHFTQNTRMLGTADMRSITNTDSDMPGGVYQLSSCLRVFGWGHPSRVPNTGAAQMGARIAGFSAVQALSSNVDCDDAYIYTNAAPAFPAPPLNMDWQGYMRNWMDSTAANVFQNAKHLSEDKVNGLSIYRSHRSSLGGGEGRDAGQGGADGQVSYGKGVRSLNLFDFERLM